MDLGIAGKYAIVLGAGADVGRAVAIQLASEGAILLLSGRKHPALEETAHLISQHGGKVHIETCDLGKPGDVELLVETAIGQFGRIDLLANTVGPFPYETAKGPALYGDDESWESLFQTVFMTAVRACRAVLPVMKAQKAGAIVNVAANSARYYSPHTAQYAAMKSALVHITKNWARDAIKSGVRVNAIMPGWIRLETLQAEIVAQATREGRPRDEVEAEMMGGHENIFWSPRMGTPQDYADAIVFLLSARAGYINGALIPVDGGSAVW